MMSRFQNSTLIVSARSPFARRVRLAFLENGINYHEKSVDPWMPVAELKTANPLGRVPTLILSSGEISVDSTLILAAFYENFQSPLHPAPGKDRWAASFWSAQAIGLCEKVIEYFLEMSRPESHRDRDLLEEIHAAVDRVLHRLNQQVEKGDFLTPSFGLTQADLDIGAALAYLDLRYPKDWQSRFPGAVRFWRKLDERPSFQATRPPQA